MPRDRDFFITNEESEKGEAGFPFHALSNAVQVYDALQEERRSIAEIASAFNCAPALIADAVRAHYWMALEDAEGRLIDGYDDETGRYSTPTSIDDYARVFIYHEGE